MSTSGTHFEDVKRLTRIIYDPTDLTRENNVYNIDYISSGATDAEKRANHCFSVIYLFLSCSYKGFQCTVDLRIDENY